MKPGIFLPAKDYDLAATLDSGQVFRWRQKDGSWAGVVGKHQVRLTQKSDGIWAETNTPMENLDWLRKFLQTEIDLEKILKTFPDDEPMNNAVTACRGLRVLRQEPWECLASFILSSTKQIIQIRQIVANLCECFGERLADGSPENFRDLDYAFPTPEKIAGLTEENLRSCRMGFRAPNLLATARQVAEGKLDLDGVGNLPYAKARERLMTLRGVGGKIADCVLLFGYGFDSAFPVDVWVERALQTLYFPKRRVNKKRLLRFAATHFGRHAGYAQQYLFHYMRTKRSATKNSTGRMVRRSLTSVK
jgi:N-glycosylase/DNA lyase